MQSYNIRLYLQNESHDFLFKLRVESNLDFVIDYNKKHVPTINF